MVTIKYGEGTASPTTTLASDQFVTLNAMGRILLKSSAFDALPSGFQNLKITADYMDRTPLMSAEVMKGLADGIGCLDTVRGQFSNGATSWGQFGWQDYGYGSYTYYEPGEGGNPYPFGKWKGNGVPAVRGIVNSDLPITEAGLDIFKLSTLSDPAKNPGDIDSGNMRAGNFSPSGTFIIGAQRHVSAVDGFIAGVIWLVDFSLFRHIPKGSVVVRALLEMTQVGAVTFEESTWDERTQVVDPSAALWTEAGYGTWADGIWFPDGSAIAPVTTSTPTTPRIGFGIIGERVGGTWDALGSFVEANSGTLEQNQTRVINVTSTVQALCDLRNSPYKQIAVHLATVNGVASTVPAENGEYNFGLLENLVTGWSSFGATQNGYEIDGWTPKYEFYGHAKALVSSASIQFGTFTVQFTVPQAALDAYRFQYGNMPPMG